MNNAEYKNLFKQFVEYYDKNEKFVVWLIDRCASMFEKNDLLYIITNADTISLIDVLERVKKEFSKNFKGNLKRANSNKVVIGKNKTIIGTLNYHIMLALIIFGSLGKPEMGDDGKYYFDSFPMLFRGISVKDTPYLIEDVKDIALLVEESYLVTFRKEYIEDDYPSENIEQRKLIVEEIENFKKKQNNKNKQNNKATNNINSEVNDYEEQGEQREQAATINASSKNPRNIKKTFKKKQTITNTDRDRDKKTKKKRNSDNFNRYIHNVFKKKAVAEIAKYRPTLKLDVNKMTKSSMKTMNTLVKDIFETIISTTESINRPDVGKAKITLQPRDIKSAVKLIFPGELAEKAIIEGNKALLETEKNTSGPKK